MKLKLCFDIKLIVSMIDLQSAVGYESKGELSKHESQQGMLSVSKTFLS